MIDKLIYVELDRDNPENNYFSGLVMEWAEGLTLRHKIIELCENKNINELTIIKNNFKKLSLFLIKEKIGHGDLKHDNIIVDKDLNLILVDYDGLYLSTFNGSLSNELGTSSFQHPKRNNQDYSRRIDEFSILTIYISLIALTINPNLLLKFYDQQNLLFRLEDFLYPDKSELIKIISSVNEIKIFIHYLKISLNSNSIYIDNIENILEGKFPEPEIVVEIETLNVLMGSNLKFAWVTNNAVTVKLNGNEIQLNGSENIIINNSTKLEFVVSNGYKEKKEVIKINAIPQPLIKIFKTNRAKIKANESVKLLFEFQHISSATLKYDNQEFDVTKQNNFHINIVKESFTAELKVIGAHGLGEATSVVSSEIVHPVAIEYFESDLKYIVQSKSIKLSWKIINATYATIMPGNIDCLNSESVVVSPNTDTTYKLIAYNELFETQNQLSINVFKVQVPHIRFPNPPQLDTKKLKKVFERVSISEDLNIIQKEMHRSLERELNVRDKDITIWIKRGWRKIFNKIIR